MSIMSVVETQNSSALKTLLLRGYCPNELNSQTYQTALHLACSHFIPDCAMLLLAAGADLYALDNKNRTPLEVVVRSNPWNVNMVMRAFASLGIPCEPTITRLFPTFAFMYYDERQIMVGCACPELFAIRNELIVNRAFEVCSALYNLRISALEMCEILLCACCPSARDVPYYKIWRIVVLIKHSKSTFRQ